MKHSDERTNVMRILDSHKVLFNSYNYLDSGAISGMEVAEALNEDPNMVFKTLVTAGKSGNHYVFLIPVNKELNLKKAAKSVGEKSIEMVKSKELLPLTGYIHGGCSPVGMKKFFRTVFDKSALSHERIYFSGGKVGVQVRIRTVDISKAIKCEFEDIVS